MKTTAKLENISVDFKRANINPNGTLGLVILKQENNKIELTFDQAETLAKVLAVRLGVKL